MKPLSLTLVMLTAASALADDLPPPEKLPQVAAFPDPLITFAGEKITTPEQWQQTRRPELKELFQNYMYGRYPSVTPEVSAKVLFEDKEAFNGKGVLSEIAVTMIKDAPPVHILFAKPKGDGPFPVFVGYNFPGNHVISDHPKVRVSEAWVRPSPIVKNNRGTEEGRGTSSRWPLETIVGRGYAVAVMYYGEVIPDSPSERSSLTKWLNPQPVKERDPDGSSAIMGWAWGIHRAIDYLTTRPDIDAKRIAAVGHSRLGKTALLAAAFDDRIAISFPSQAGCGGTGPSRNNNPNAETVKRITTSFPHWFCPNFSQFGDDTSRIPFDQHSLVAICAPRPVLFTCATGDQWANPPGQFDVLKAATPVYQLLGEEGLKATEYPEENQLIDSRLGFWVRPGKHDMTLAEWETYMAFADKWMK